MSLTPELGELLPVEMGGGHPVTDEIDQDVTVRYAPRLNNVPHRRNLTRCTDDKMTAIEHQGVKRPTEITLDIFRPLKGACVSFALGSVM